MTSSAVLLAKRALVTLMRSLATTYQIGVGIHRDAQDDAVMSTFSWCATRIRTAVVRPCISSS